MNLELTKIWSAIPVVYSSTVSTIPLQLKIHRFHTNLTRSGHKFHTDVTRSGHKFYTDVTRSGHKFHTDLTRSGHSFSPVEILQELIASFREQEIWEVAVEDDFRRPFRVTRFRLF